MKLTLTRDRITGSYYTEDRLFKIQRCTVRAYGWDISKKREDGAYRIWAHAATLPEARKRIIEKGEGNRE